jgi:hypothetical protein
MLTYLISLGAGVLVGNPPTSSTTVAKQTRSHPG